MAFSYLFKSALKLGFVGGAIYGTINLGLWGSSRQSIDAYNKLKSSIPREYVETITEKVKVPKIPIEDYMKKSIREYWNSGVLCTFYGISVLPRTVSHYSKVGWDKANEAFAGTSTSAK